MLVASTGNALSLEKYYELPRTMKRISLVKHMVYTHETTGYPREEDFDEHEQEL
jgi:hypothetical protein